MHFPKHTDIIVLKYVSGRSQTQINIHEHIGQAVNGKMLNKMPTINFFSKYFDEFSQFEKQNKNSTKSNSLKSLVLWGAQENPIVISSDFELTQVDYPATNELLTEGGLINA